MIVLIPSYQPTERLLTVVRELRESAPWMPVLVVDDGSGPAYRPLFDAARALGAEVIGYSHNRGKGHALRTGFAHIQEAWPDHDVVSADSDGQHSTADILRVAERISGGDIVLGGRRFAGEVPLRSRFGNAVSRGLFRFTAGTGIHDTQTGLRGYPASALDWLQTVGGNRFEYELKVLLGARAEGYRLRELEIETIYLEHNASSHFRPVVDSVRVMLPMLRFVFSSLAAFVIDFVLLQVLFAVTGTLWLSVLGSRVVSASANFAVNRRMVFRSSGGVWRDALRYLALALALLASSYVWLAALTGLGVPLAVAKLISDVALYLLSFQVQRRFVFATSPRARPSARAGIPARSAPGSAPRAAAETPHH